MTKDEAISVRECLKNIFPALPDCQIWQVFRTISVFRLGFSGTARAGVAIPASDN